MHTIRRFPGEAFGGRIDRDIKIVYSPLNGTGLKLVCGVLKETGSLTYVVEEQSGTDGHFYMSCSESGEGGGHGPGYT